MTESDYQSLSTYKTHTERVQANWPKFLVSREEKLAQGRRFQAVPEKAAEEIIGCLLTEVLDWNGSDLNWQLKYADLVITHNFCKHLLVETKRPGSLCGSREALIQAFAQAHRYADDQHVTTVAVTDGHILRVADVADGGLKLRCAMDLESAAPPVDPLWWISVHGIYRPPPLQTTDLYEPFAETHSAPLREDGVPEPVEELLHHKYHLPARCFAYVPDASDPSGWKLPYRLADNTPDAKRLPKAIQSLLSNYRGAQVGGIPDESIPAVMHRLNDAAREVGKMPDQLATTANAYKQLAEALVQLPPGG